MSKKPDEMPDEISTEEIIKDLAFKGMMKCCLHGFKDRVNPQE
ncbi:MAG: hypothetical protein ACXV8O_19845 [Methylobacter sp.]